MASGRGVLALSSTVIVTPLRSPARALDAVVSQDDPVELPTRWPPSSLTYAP